MRNAGCHFCRRSSTETDFPGIEARPGTEEKLATVADVNGGDADDENAVAVDDCEQCGVVLCSVGDEDADVADLVVVVVA